MNIGKACAIFEQIDSDKYSDAEKLEAVREVVKMPTHNGIAKATMLTVLRWFAENTEPVIYGHDVANTPSLFECSVCGWLDSDTLTGDTSTYNYCPNCGAKMDGGSDEEV